MQRINTGKIKLTILLLSLVQMATTGLSPMLSSVSEAFPDVSTSSIQFLMTIPGIFVVIFALLSAWISRHIRKRTLISIGACFIFLSGILAFFLHGNIMLLRLWSAALGVGMGLVSALTNSLAADYFEGNEKAGLMGQITGMGNAGGMIMSIVGGILATVAWHYNYLVFLLALPGLFCCILFVPKENKQAPVNTDGASASKLSSNTISFAVTACIFLFCYNVGPANLSMLIAEKEIGGSALTGVAAAVYLLGGALLGLMFGKLDSLLKIYTLPAGFLLLAVGFLGILASNSAAPLILFCLIGGAAISMIMPQCMNQVSQNPNPPQAAFAIALVMAGSNLGTFLTPFLSKISAAVTDSENAAGKFRTSAVLGIALFVVYVILVTWKKRKNNAEI
ncbi:MAG: MFS transporter [Eubacterium sp.]|nr:MFS transporter [Eubacterium sp.]